MTQEIIVAILFIVAVYFVGKKIYMQTFAHKAKPGCEKCEAEKK
ncbi:MAG: hypothetical protein POELPBGB_00188 [Bacteroidia bacterium]|nr:hypothetical protein [Bacteroidia bacterium]